MTNTLAYYGTELITAVKSLIVQAPANFYGLHSGNIFFSVILTLECCKLVLVEEQIFHVSLIIAFRLIA